MEKYFSWDNQTPGLTFCKKSGRITIFKRTLEALGFPAYYRFLFDPDKGSFAVQGCDMDDEGSHKMPKLTRKECCEINSLALVRFVYMSCRWNDRYSYRIAGRIPLNSDIVSFDLNKALEIHEGRLIDFREQKE